jgi:drug/metabolite transporter (DMT)-like permease
LVEKQDKTESAQKQSKIYILVASVAAVVISTSNLVKGFVTENPLACVNWFCLTHLVLAAVCLAVMFFKDRSSFKLPCRRRKGDSEEYEWSWFNFVALVGGGACELGICLSIFFAFQACAKYSINSGISTVVMPSNAILVILTSYCLYKEKVLALHFVGVLIIIGSVVLIVLTPPGGDDSSAAVTTGQLMIVIAYSCSATLCQGLQVIFSKALAMRQVAGMTVGFWFLFTEGTLGSLYLLASYIGGVETSYVLSLKDIGITAFGALCAFTAVTMLQVSVSIGVAGLALAIFNTNSVILTLFSRLFLAG